MTAAGVAKLIEECGELTQVLGKKLAMWDQDDHWDGTNLRTRMEEEIADVSAACVFVVEHMGLDQDAITERMHRKLDLFETWQVLPDNNDHGIDSGRPADDGSPT